MTIDDLLAKEEITDVIKRLARGTDRLDEALMASCYHPDGFDDHNSFRGSGTEFAKWVCDVLPHFVATHHFIADPYIRVEGDIAQVDTYCEAHHVGADTDMVLGLRYVDRFERRDGVWKIAERQGINEWLRYEPSSDRGFWDGQAGQRGRRDRDDPVYRR